MRRVKLGFSALHRLLRRLYLNHVNHVLVYVGTYQRSVERRAHQHKMHRHRRGHRCARLHPHRHGLADSYPAHPGRPRPPTKQPRKMEHLFAFCGRWSRLHNINRPSRQSAPNRHGRSNMYVLLSRGASHQTNKYIKGITFQSKLSVLSSGQIGE